MTVSAISLAREASTRMRRRLRSKARAESTEQSAEDELVRAEAALGGARKVREGVEENGGGGLDLHDNEAREGDVLDNGDPGEGFLLEGAIFDAVGDEI
ncbi:hypothetical protein L484_025171 [Morus notabilis]|uniref:Uncharacterized protein n=1 Tax=Morus notabilis TaxID=981085 RepID=W9RZP7_9ROSA|nr:hypothetical protein L484_025171 [Morus notabilis]